MPESAPESSLPGKFGLLAIRESKRAERAEHCVRMAWVFAWAYCSAVALHAGYATWFVEQERPQCAPTHRLWNPQDIGRVRLQHPSPCCTLGLHGQC